MTESEKEPEKAGPFAALAPLFAAYRTFVESIAMDPARPGLTTDGRNTDDLCLFERAKLMCRKDVRHLVWGYLRGELTDLPLELLADLDFFTLTFEAVAAEDEKGGPTDFTSAALGIREQLIGRTMHTPDEDIYSTLTFKPEFGTLPAFET